MIPKKKLTYIEQIEHLKQKGITFHYINEKEALRYLQKNNNFFKLSSYRKNFNKDLLDEKYLNLDFAYLVDLAKLDMYLRFIIIQMALNIEHFAKVLLIGLVTNTPHEDGYTIVADYISSLPESGQSHIQSELERNSKSPYCRDAFEKYKNNLPIWVFLELISFGSFISFYKYAIDRFSPLLPPKVYKKYNDNFFLMLSVKYIRNASAHNNCILNDLKNKSDITRKKANWKMTAAMNRAGISSESINKKLANERLQQIITCFWAHKLIVSSEGVHHRMSKLLHEWSKRLYRDYDYSFNNLLKSSFDVLSTLIDKWFSIV